MEYILYEKKNRIAYITLNRPEVLNALHPPAVAELSAIWEDFKTDPDLWVAIVTGSGDRSFCAGDDLKYRADGVNQQSSEQSYKEPQYGPVNCFKPVIAAVNGYAVGGGFELVLGCDIVIASRDAKFGLPEVRRGLIADAGGVLKLPRRIPYHLAMSMILTGKLFSAEELRQFGLVSEVVELEELGAAALRWADMILECSPLAVQASKQTIAETLDLPLKEAEIKLNALSAVKRLRESGDYLEGPLAFAEKRPPVWKGF